MANIRPPMRAIELLVETYLIADRDLATAFGTAAGKVQLQSLAGADGAGRS
jgi:hypothetical protein